MKLGFAAVGVALFTVLTGSAQAGRHLTARPGEEVSDGLLVRFREGAQIRGSKVPARFLASSRWRALRLPNVHRVQVDPSEHFSAGAALADDPAVEWVEPDRIRHLSIATPNDPRYLEQWNLAAIRAKEAWQWFPGRYLTSSLNLERVRVAILDSGADCTHPDFANAGNSSTDSQHGGQLNWARSNAWLRTTIESPACDWQDDNGHGTIVAGIAAAATHNAAGVASLGAMLELMIYKIAGANGLATDSALANYILYATDRGARVINMSLGHAGYSETLQQAADHAWARNVVLVAALGNSGTTDPSFPASNHHVIGVGATDSTGALASFSNRGRPVDVVAPGASILSTTPITAGRYLSTYDLSSGTSMAAPHVAALAGLLAMASPGALADEIARRIERSAELAGDGWSSDFGYGRIDAERAITGANWRASSTGSVSGLIRNSNGTTLAGALIVLNSVTIYSEVGGIFRISGVPPGDYTMTVELLSSPQSALSVPVTVTAGADTPVSVRIGTSYGTLRGTVTAGGVPVAGTVVAAMQGNLQQTVAVTNSLGQYRLFVPAGTYSVKTGGMFMSVASTAEDQTVAAGAIRDVPTLASQNFGRLEGQVRSSQNAAVQGAQVLVAKSGRIFGAVSGPAGDYRTLPGPADAYVASAEHPTGGVSQPATVSIVDGVTGRLDLVLGPEGQSLTVTPGSASFTATGGTGSVSILAGSPQLNWTGTSNASWLSITSSVAGTGSGTLNYGVAYNLDSAARSARITVNGAFITVTQAGATDAVTANPSSLNLGANTVNDSIALTSAGFWSAVSQNSWITLPSSTTGSGNGFLNYRVESNLTGASRTGQIKVNTLVIPVTQAGASLLLRPETVTVPAKSFEGATHIEVFTEIDKVWSVTTNSSWITFFGPTSRTGPGNMLFFVADNTSTAARTGIINFTGGVQLTVTQVGANALQLSPSSIAVPAARTVGSFVVSGPPPYYVVSRTGWTRFSGPQGNTVDYQIDENPGPGARTGTILVSDAVFTVSQAAPPPAPPPTPVPTTGGLHFVPVQPCRVADTRENMGSLGKPALAGGAPRDFQITAAPCGIPSSAKAFALNVTVVPKGGLGYLSIFPAGQPQPLVSTLNSMDGRIKANAAIVPAGTNGSITVFATDSTELILDIFGYFADPGWSLDGLAFYPIAPCRVSDTRNANGSLGGPILGPGSSRSLPVLSSNCGIPSSARAYSLNVTAVPSGPLGYLTLWPSGRSQPFVSTLNAPTGSIVANAAIVPAGDNGAISAYATNATHVVVDINGYFALPGEVNAQRFFAVTPCRVLDTRNPIGNLGGPIHFGGETRTWPAPASTCGLPESAKAYSLNATVVPAGGLGYLSMWPAGEAQPFVSTLNAMDDPIVANAAIVVAGSGGAVSTFATNHTHLIVDTNGYFAP